MLTVDRVSAITDSEVTIMDYITGAIEAVSPHTICISKAIYDNDAGIGQDYAGDWVIAGVSDRAIVSVTRDILTLWVCVDCLTMCAGGEVDSAEVTDREPLGEIDSGHLVPGLHPSEHCGECVIHDNTELGCDMDCEAIAFSRSRCDGCGSPLGGERYAVTLLDGEVGFK